MIDCTEDYEYLKRNDVAADLLNQLSERMDRKVILSEYDLVRLGSKACSLVCDELFKGREAEALPEHYELVIDICAMVCAKVGDLLFRPETTKNDTSERKDK